MNEFTVGSFVTKMEQLAPFLIRALGIDVKMDYSLDDLRRIESEFGRRWHGKPVLSVTTYLPFSYMLGETIVRNVPGAEWTNLESENPWDMCVTVPVKSPDGEPSDIDIVNKMKCYPMTRVEKFHKDKEDRLTTLYWMTSMLSKHTSTELLKMGEHIGDGWHTFTDDAGDTQMMRIMSPKDQDAASNLTKEELDNLPVTERLAHVADDAGNISTQPVENIKSITRVKEEAAAAREKEREKERTQEMIEEHKKNIRGKTNYKF